MAEIKINTRINNTKLKSDLKELNKLIEEELDLKNKKQKIEIDIADYENQLKELQTLKEEYAKKGMVAFANATQDQIDLLKLTEQPIYEKNKKDLEDINVLLNQNVEAQAKLNAEIQKAQFNEIKDAIGDVGKSIGDIVKKVLKWGLAVISVRSAYLFIRQLVSSISQYNKQLKTDIDYMKFAIANALEPAIQKLIDLLYTLLSYVNYLTKAWFNIDLNDGAKKFKSMSKSAKEIKNSLAGFDEMNILADTSTSGGSGTGNIRSFDFEGETPKWLEMVEKIGRWVLENWQDVLSTLALSKMVIDILTGNWIGVIIDFVFFLILNLPKLIQALKEFWRIVAEVFENIKNAIKEKIEIATNFIKEKFEAIKSWFKETFTWENIEAFVRELPLKIETFTKNIVNVIYGAFDFMFQQLGLGAQKTWEAIKKAFSKVGEFFSGIWDTIKSKFTKIGTSIGEAVSNAFKTVINSVITFAQNTINKFIKAINKAIDVINVIPGVNIKKLTEINIPKLATGGIVNRPTYAQIGEAGREAVLPLDRNTEWMNELAKKINSNGGVVNVYLDGRLIQRQYNQRQEEFNFATNGGI